MSRLADDLLKGSVPAPWVTSMGGTPAFQVRGAMEKSADYARSVVLGDPVIDISNVADFVWESQEELSTTNKDHFPCLTPPFKRMWMEYRRPPVFTHQRDDLLTEEGKKQWEGKRLGGKWVRADTSGWPIDRYGFLIDCVDLEAGETLKDFPVPMELPPHQTFDMAIHPDSRWVVRIQVFVRSKGEKKVQGPLIYWLGGLDDKGVLLQDAVTAVPAANYMEPEERFYWTTVLIPTIAPALRAISYMHCKNISQETHIPAPKLSKKHEKRYGQPLLKFRTLVIQPLMAGGKSSGGGGGGAKSHHFVRGHFADYREKGLFGKENLKRIFWFDVHMRGSKEVGEVVGDYEVKPPEEEGAA